MPVLISLSQFISNIFVLRSNILLNLLEFNLLKSQLTKASSQIFYLRCLLQDCFLSFFEFYTCISKHLFSDDCSWFELSFEKSDFNMFVCDFDKFFICFFEKRFEVRWLLWVFFELDIDIFNSIIFYCEFLLKILNR